VCGSKGILLHFRQTIIGGNRCWIDFSDGNKLFTIVQYEFIMFSEDSSHIGVLKPKIALQKLMSNFSNKHHHYTTFFPKKINLVINNSIVLCY